MTLDKVLNKFVRSRKVFMLNTRLSKYIQCLFDLSILPIKMNLPMIYPPVDWGISYYKELEFGEIPQITGGLPTYKKYGFSTEQV